TLEVGSPVPASAGLEVYWNGVPLTLSSPITSTMQVVTLTGLTPDANGQGVLSFREVGTVDFNGTYLANISLAPAGAPDLPLLTASLAEDGSVALDLSALSVDFGGDGP